MHKGTHLLIDCSDVPREICLNDGLVLDVMAASARQAGAEVLSQVRYHFGHNSPPGFAVAILLDESHCTAHSYAELGLIAFDIFTCGSANPRDLFAEMRNRLDLGTASVREIPRFPLPPITSTEIPHSSTNVFPAEGEDRAASVTA